MNFREVNKGSRIIRLVGLIHERSSLSASAASSILYELVHWKPDVFLVETGKKSLELSKFVWEHKGPTCSPVQYCHEESCNNEAYAIAACHQMGTSHVPIFPVDVEPFKTRLKLAKSALMHPLDALRLISRYNGKNSEITSLEEIDEWRRQFKRACPYSFDILFTQREHHMLEEINRYSSRFSRTAVLMGLSHVDAIYDRLR
jgi:hypothetical protein